MQERKTGLVREGTMKQIGKEIQQTSEKSADNKKLYNDCGRDDSYALDEDENIKKKYEKGF